MTLENSVGANTLIADINTIAAKLALVLLTVVQFLLLEGTSTALTMLRIMTPIFLDGCSLKVTDVSITVATANALDLNTVRQRLRRRWDQ